MNLQIIQHGTAAYNQMLQLRIKVLLNPIGVSPSFINTEKEKEDILIAAFEEQDMVGCCVLTKRDKETVQLRQMAVDDVVQGKGVGSAIIQFAEQVAKENGYSTIMMHARSAVVPFYLKNGYYVTGDAFEEVGIAHRFMQKKLL
mgnify:CR=1 FL=1